MNPLKLMASARPRLRLRSFALLFSGSNAGLGELTCDITSLEAYNLKNLVSTLFSRYQAHAGARNTKRARDKFDCGFVGFSIHWRRIQAQNPFVVTASGEFGFPR